MIGNCFLISFAIVPSSLVTSKVGFSLSFTSTTLTTVLLKGKFPKKQLKLVEAWSIIHKKELEADWLLCKNNEELFTIQPLI